MLTHLFNRFKRRNFGWCPAFVAEPVTTVSGRITSGAGYVMKRRVDGVDQYREMTEDERLHQLGESAAP